jgi:prepilin-type N-terminal cleavage/methylation domain-containing protein
MPHGKSSQRNQRETKQTGFSLIELMIAVSILLAVSAIVLTMMVQMTKSQASISNRTDMHSSVRSVTSLLQQEISQAGRVALPHVANCDQLGQPPCGTTTLTNAVSLADPKVPETRTELVGSTTGMFDSILLFVGAGGTCANCDSEVIEATIPASGSITATFRKSHGAGARIWPSGGFVTGILPTSDGYTLKMYGDINDDGNMVYVEYVCSPSDAGDGTLTRSQTAWDAATKATPEVLLGNLETNPDDATTGQPVPCFTYQTKSTSWMALDGVTTRTANTVVLNIGVTLTARTPFQQRSTDDPSTTIDERYDYETKALLTVSPRNVFQAYQMAGLPGAGQHVIVEPSAIGGNACCIATLEAE